MVHFDFSEALAGWATAGNRRADLGASGLLAKKQLFPPILARFCTVVSEGHTSIFADGVYWAALAGGPASPCMCKTCTALDREGQFSAAGTFDILTRSPCFKTMHLVENSIYKATCEL